LIDDRFLEFQSENRVCSAWNARELTRPAMDSAEHNGAKETAAGYQAGLALREVEAGNRENARAEADAALKLAQHRDVKVATHWLLRERVMRQRRRSWRRNSTKPLLSIL
jgi:hypothetical protein